MGNDISSGLLSMAVCFDFFSNNVVQLSNRNPYFYWFRWHTQFNPIKHLVLLVLSELYLDTTRKRLQCSKSNVGR